MPILRKHKTGSFTQVHNDCLNDEALGWKAKGLLVFLLSKPDDWEFSIEQLSTIGPDGQDSTRTAMHELMDNGYVDRNRTRGEDGTYAGWVYHVYEQPPTTDTDDSSPAVGKPYGGDEGGQTNTVTTNTVDTNTDNGTSPSSNDSGDGATHPRTQGGTDDQTPDPPTVQWQPPEQLFDSDTTLPTTTGDGAPPQTLDVPQSPQEIREWVGSTDTGSMGWRVGEIFRGLFCPWLTDDELRKKYLGRLLSEANRMVGEATYDGSPMDKPRSRIELAVALVHLYQERDDLHGREDPGARKDQPTAVLNVLADQITRKVKDDEQQQGHDRRPDDPLHQLVAEAEHAHA